MKVILQVIISLLLTSNLIYANEFREVQEISLKKDMVKKILVKYDGKERLFKFRWTLFINDGLVVFRSYDKIVHQNVLYKKYKNKSFRQELKTRGRDFYNVPYILVQFVEFKHDTNEAVFKLLLSDASQKIILKHLN